MKPMDITTTPLAPVEIDEQQEAVEALLEKSARRSRRVNIRNSFVQHGTQRRPVHGPLHLLLRAHDERALDLFLLHRAVVSSGIKDDNGNISWHAYPLDARVWGRALGLGGRVGGGSTAVAKAWRRLEDYRLVRRGRDGRLSVVTSLREDGLGGDYDSPDGKTAHERYLTLPFEYWTAEERWYQTLGLPAKVVLLVGSTLKPGFLLPTEKAPAWYGISTESAERGLRTLRQVGLLDRQSQLKRAPLSPNGYTREWHYTLTPPFGQPQPSVPLAPGGRRQRLVTAQPASRKDVAPATWPKPAVHRGSSRDILQGLGR